MRTSVLNAPFCVHAHKGLVTGLINSSKFHKRVTLIIRARGASLKWFFKCSIKAHYVKFPCVRDKSNTGQPSSGSAIMSVFSMPTTSLPWIRKESFSGSSVIAASLHTELSTQWKHCYWRGCWVFLSSVNSIIPGENGGRIPHGTEVLLHTAANRWPLARASRQ